MHRAVVGSTPSDQGSVADNEMVALLDRHLVERRSTHQVVDPLLDKPDLARALLAGHGRLASLLIRSHAETCDSLFRDYQDTEPDQEVRCLSVRWS